MFILYYVSFNHLPEHLDACVCVFGARLDVVSVSHKTKMEIIMQMHLQRIEKQNTTQQKIERNTNVCRHHPKDFPTK